MAGIGEIVALAKGLGGSGGGGSSGGGAFVVHASDDSAPVLDKTWKEIKDAFDGGSVVVLVSASNDLYYLGIVPTQLDESVYGVTFFAYSGADSYYATSENGYPVWSAS